MWLPYAVCEGLATNRCSGPADKEKSMEAIVLPRGAGTRKGRWSGQGTATRVAVGGSWFSPGPSQMCFEDGVGGRVDPKANPPMGAARLAPQKRGNRTQPAVCTRWGANRRVGVRPAAPGGCAGPRDKHVTQKVDCDRQRASALPGSMHGGATMTSRPAGRWPRRGRRCDSTG